MSFEHSCKNPSFFVRALKIHPTMLFLALFLVAICASHSSQAETVIVSTLAGSEKGFADGKGSAARFWAPQEIAIDAAGNLYVADWSNSSIRKVTPAGEVSTLAGGEYGFADGRGSAARFHLPGGIAIDVTDNLYVADMNNNRIRKVTPNGEVTTLAGGERGFADGQGSAARFYIPAGIAIDAAGSLYVADADNHSIRKVTPKGEVSTLAGSGKKGSTDGQGNAAQFHRPYGIAIDTAGNLYVADKNNHRIRKVTPKGEVSTFAGSEKGFADGQGSAARFNYPTGITIDTTGNLYVTDNHRIRKVTPRGEVSTFAGGELVSGIRFVDGQGSSARFYMPYGIVIGTDGNLYVADTWNHRIRKIVIQRP